MISILLNWCYILFTAYGLGFAFGKFTEYKLRYKIKSADALIFTGIIMATVYAQLFSLFYKVGTVANIVLVIASVVVYIVYWREIYGNIRSFKSWFIIPLVLIWCYCTSRGYIHYDSDLYHAQSIRWIEEYGIVKGLGNIHVRFAYNSSFFALQALYSMKPLTGVSLHAVNGFIALLLSNEVVRLALIPKKGRVEISDFARAGAFYYLTVIYREIVSPATDYTIMCIIFYIIIKWLVLLERDEESVVPYSLICVAGVYAVSVKLTAGVILLILIKPAYMLIRDRLWGDIARFILMGVVTILPWIARTVVISGYVLYPCAAIDIFDVDWKISATRVVADAAEIKTWGRGLYDASLVDLKISEWFPNWFDTTLSKLGKILVSLDLVCIVVFALLLIIGIYRRDKKALDRLLVLGAVIASYVFWQTSAPLLRYGYAYVILTVAITAGILWENMIGKYRKNVIIYTVVISALAAVKTISLVSYVYDTADQPYYLEQKGYGTYSLNSYEVNGVTFYYPESGDRVGYDSFPAIPREIDIVFRGDDMSDGFKSGDN
jgi:hypothetical protein